MVLGQLYWTGNIRIFSCHNFGVVVSVAFHLIGIVVRISAVAYGTRFMASIKIIIFEFAWSSIHARLSWKAYRSQYHDWRSKHMADVLWRRSSSSWLWIAWSPVHIAWKEVAVSKVLGLRMVDVLWRRLCLSILGFAWSSVHTVAQSSSMFNPTGTYSRDV